MRPLGYLKFGLLTVGVIVLFGLQACSSLNKSLSKGHDTRTNIGQRKTAEPQKLKNRLLYPSNTNSSSNFPYIITKGLENNKLKELTEPLEEEVTAMPEETGDKALSQAEKEALDSGTEVKFHLNIRETKIMRKYFKFYTQSKKKTFQDWLKRSEPYLPSIKKVFREKGLPEDLVFLPFAESGFNPFAYSSAGAAGLWQFIPSTARIYGLRVDWWVDERRDPYKATEAAASYLKKLYDQFGDWYLVLAAYNTGEGRVARVLERSGKSSYFELTKTREYFCRETRNYVPKFMAILKIIRNMTKLGFEPIDWDNERQIKSVQVEPGTNVYALAKELGIGWDKFRHLNPAYRRIAVPPEGKWSVHLPKKYFQKAKAFLNNPKNKEYRAGYFRYRISKGDSWWRLSRMFHVPIHVLKTVNNRRSNILRPGQYVLVSKTSAGNLAGLSSGSSGKKIYVVRRGDSFWSISRKFGLSINQLKRVNDRVGSKLRVGEKLIIPGSGLGRSHVRKIAKKRANYTVQKGDTLWEISRVFNVSLNTLIQANGLSKYSTLHVGDKIYIPGSSQADYSQAKKAALKKHAELINYIVQKGDNLWYIAQKFGVSTDQLLAWNDLGAKELIHPGDSLKIYLD